MKFRVIGKIQGDLVGASPAPRRTEEGWNPILCRAREVGVYLDGDTVEAKLADVANLVAVKYGGNLITAEAVLEPIGVEAAPVELPGADVDLSKLDSKGLASHARKYHNMGLGNQSEERREMLRRIGDAREAEAALYR